jgi:hypothetical protein
MIDPEEDRCWTFGKDGKPFFWLETRAGPGPDLHVEAVCHRPA